MLVDSHCHLDFPELSERLTAVLAAMAEAGVGYALCAGVSLERFPALLALVESSANLFAAVGVHPDGEADREADVETLVKLADHPRVVAIGETGLDYYRLTGDLEWQRERFRIHIRAAKLAGKPLIIHTRSAAADTLRILEEEDAGAVGGVMHCFTETWDIAEAALDLGLYISFSGIVTFKNAQALREVANRVPLDRLLVETDSPYLAPQPHRGKINEPAYVAHVAEALSTIRQLPLQEFAAATSANFFRLFPAAQRQSAS